MRGGEQTAWRITTHGRGDKPAQRLNAMSRAAPFIGTPNLRRSRLLRAILNRLWGRA